MASKADFNAEEWDKVVQGPLFAGMRVVAAERGGTLRESLAIGRVFQEARKAQGDNELLDAMVGSPPSVDPQSVQGGGDIATVSAERLREGLALVGEKGSAEDAEAYKQFVLAVAQAAAEAHKEGGFAGIGGKPVSDQEQAALDEIQSLLNAPG